MKNKVFVWKTIKMQTDMYVDLIEYTDSYRLYLYLWAKPNDKFCIYPYTDILYKFLQRNKVQDVDKAIANLNGNDKLSSLEEAKKAVHDFFKDLGCRVIEQEQLDKLNIYV